MRARDLPTWREAWTTALYGPDGFFRQQAPGDHFRTSVHASPMFAEALLRLVRELKLDTVVDVGAGGGNLLRHLRDRSGSDLTLVGVDLAPRPAGLPGAIAWRADLPGEVDGLLVANEWLDNIACDVVEVDDDGVARYVHVDSVSGEELLGKPCHEQWLRHWWPLREPGTRAEIGSTRDRAWADVVRRVRRGVAIAIDYGHTAQTRPTFGSLASYQHGRQVDVIPDGSRDITAHVAVDSLHGDRTTQRAALAALGVVGDRPPIAQATSDPKEYVQRLSRATEAAELTDQRGLGDFWWLVHAPGGLDGTALARAFTARGTPGGHPR